VNAPDLDDPEYARFAWGRYKRLMAWMTLASFGAVLIGLAALNYAIGDMPLLGTAFAAGGIFFTVLLAAALMGLVFLSSGSGHDFKIEDPTRPEEER
jgi:formate hydrogenlyase subunit 3/multisubunit Na+/H+ antiporter MnhD subunit